IRNHGKIPIQQKRIFAQPSMRKFAVKIDPHIKPADARHGPMPMPFSGPIETRLPCPDLLASDPSVNHSTPTRDEPKTKFSKHASFFPFELVIRGVPWPRIRLMGAHIFPACVRHIKRLLEKSIVQRKRVGMVGWMSHFDVYYKWFSRVST